MGRNRRISLSQGGLDCLLVKKWVVQEEIPDKCPNCGKKGTFVRDEESGEMVCSNCGFILSEKEEETGPSFSSESGSPHITSGPPTSLAQPDMGLDTVIGREGRDASGGKISGRARSSVDRMRVWDRRSQPNQSAFQEHEQGLRRDQDDWREALRERGGNRARGLHLQEGDREAPDQGKVASSRSRRRRFTRPAGTCRSRGA